MSSEINNSFNCIAVIGPTASGKTALAALIAYELGGEVISADSRQVYRGLDIGTGKDLHQYSVNGISVPYHLIGITEPTEQYYLHNFIEDLAASFTDVVSRKKLPVICGGSGLYLDAIRKDFTNTQVLEDKNLRSQLQSLSKAELLQKLASFSESHTAKVDKTSVKRIVRGIEVAEYLRHNSLKASPPVNYRPYYIGLHPSKEKIAERIARRLEQRLGEGLIDEVRSLLSSGISHARLEQLGLEYKFISLHLRGELSLPEMKDKLFTAIRQFSKRQLTWFRKMEKEGVTINWLPENFDTNELVTKLKGLFTSRRGS